MAVVASIGDGCNLVVKHTFWELEDGEMEEISAQRPRAFTDSVLVRSSCIDDATDDYADDDDTCMHDETLSAVETDAGSSEGETSSPQPSFLWSDSDDEETAPLGPPPGTFGCQMPPLQWVPVPVPVMGQIPGRSWLGETDVKGCRAEVKPQNAKASYSEPKKAKQTVLRALKKARQTVEAAQ
jgi:hypothetical protein